MLRFAMAKSCTRTLDRGGSSTTQAQHRRAAAALFLAELLFFDYCFLSFGRETSPAYDLRGVSLRCWNAPGNRFCFVFVIEFVCFLFEYMYVIMGNYCDREMLFCEEMLDEITIDFDSMNVVTEKVNTLQPQHLLFDGLDDEFDFSSFCTDVYECVKDPNIVNVDVNWKMRLSDEDFENQSDDECSNDIYNGNDWCWRHNCGFFDLDGNCICYLCLKEIEDNVPVVENLVYDFYGNVIEHEVNNLGPWNQLIERNSRLVDVVDVDMFEGLDVWANGTLEKDYDNLEGLCLNEEIRDEMEDLNESLNNMNL